MYYSLRITILYIMFVIFVYFGLCLIFGKIPSKLKNSSYSRSRTLMGCAYLQIATFIAYFRIIGFPQDIPFFSTAFNLSCYYLSTVLILASLISMMGKKRYYPTKRLVRNLSEWLAYSLVLYFTITIPERSTTFEFIVLLAIVLLCKVFISVYQFFKAYKLVIKRAELYYSDSIETSIRWMMKSVYLVISVGITGVGVAFAAFIPNSISVCFLIYFLFVFTYIFTSFNSFMITYNDKANEQTQRGEDIEIVPETVLTTSIRSDVMIRLKKNTDKWIGVKGYTQQGITIQSVATELETNRTYLASYIKITYNVGFKDWVTALRIEESKVFMNDNSKILIAEVAKTVGFASAASYTRAFSRHEEISPARWREQCNIAKESEQQSIV